MDLETLFSLLKRYQWSKEVILVSSCRRFTENS
jgi:hypothetical protein